MTDATGRLIVDAQMHLWQADTPARPWTPGARAQLPEPMTIERLVPMMDEAGVDRVVIVPPTLEGLRLDYGQEAARRYPGRFAVMSRVNLDDPGEATRIAALHTEPAVVGTRLFFQPHMMNWLSDGTADWFWPVAEKAGLPVMFLTNGQSPAFGPIAERHPGLKLIIDHMGMTFDAVKEDRVAERVAEAAALAKYPNVSVKLSSIPLYSREDFPWRDMTPHIRRLFDAFGPRRCYWGTDITNSLAKATYRQRIDHFTRTLDFPKGDDLDWVMGKAIVETLGWR